MKHQVGTIFIFMSEMSKYVDKNLMLVYYDVINNTHVEY